MFTTEAKLMCPRRRRSFLLIWATAPFPCRGMELRGVPTSSALETGAQTSPRNLVGATAMEPLARYATLTAVIVMLRSLDFAVSTSELKSWHPFRLFGVSSMFEQFCSVRIERLGNTNLIPRNGCLENSIAWGGGTFTHFGCICRT